MHEKQWNFLRNKYEANQLGHAYLFSGFDGLGKKDFAKKFTEFIGCKFPDLMVIEPKGEIKILQIREVQNFLSYKSYNGGYKAVIINAAHLMNAEAQNCFLKTLEEPKGETLLMLISSKPELLLPTIYSRCQILKFFGKPAENLDNKKILEDILKVAGKDLAEKFKYAKNLDFEEQNFSDILKVLQMHYREILFSENFEEKNRARKILEIIDKISYKAVFTNINEKLALEVLLMQI